MQNLAYARRMVFMEWNRPPDSVPADIPADDREKFYDDVAEYISTHSGEFDAAANEYARKRLSSDLYQKPLEDTSFNWTMFGDEVANNAVKITSAGGNVIKNAVYLAVVVLIVVYFMPRIVTAFKK